MAQGIIRTLKSNFPKNLILEIIECLNIGVSVECTEITVLDVILIIHDACTKLTQRTIFN